MGGKQSVSHKQPIKPYNLSNCTCKDEKAKLQTCQSQLKSMGNNNMNNNMNITKQRPNNNMNNNMNITMQRPNNNMNITKQQPNNNMNITNKQIITHEMSNHLPMFNGILYAHSDGYICGKYNPKNDQLMHLNCSTGKQIKPAFDNPFNCVTKAQGTRSEWTRPSLKLIDTHTPKHQNAGNVYKIVGC